ncbi:DUF350 domain-containing protein [Enterovirga rhinocerotis]|uniref:Putative membrane protein n=1 Tax=Enterovirga rhinocerotis TaxID=1339210 RepID=A0A4R7CB69_9HYPH|nr:DUF350 domain-containing protein [Enterovirga rhinocerotis]TDR93997.1 putative membrane protein [Enterovirga rhinocerotis]
MTAIAGLANFLVYFGTALGLVALYLVVYTLSTSQNEIALIRQNVTSAALALGLSLVGFALPLSSAVVYAQEVLDAIVWGVVAIAVQILAYWLVRLLVPRLPQRIAAGEMSGAILLGAASLAAGIINAAAMR